MDIVYQQKVEAAIRRGKPVPPPPEPASPVVSGEVLMSTDDVQYVLDEMTAEHERLIEEVEESTACKLPDRLKSLRVASKRVIQQAKAKLVDQAKAANKYHAQRIRDVEQQTRNQTLSKMADLQRAAVPGNHIHTAPPPSTMSTPCEYRGSEATQDEKVDLDICKGKQVLRCNHPKNTGGEWAIRGYCTINEGQSNPSVWLCRRCDKRKAPADFRLIHKPKVLGRNFHRSGWPPAYHALQLASTGDGILLDDFIEQNWCYGNKTVYPEPWVGIFHHPPNPPEWSHAPDQLSGVFQTEKWKESAKHLKGAVALTDYLATWLREQLDCPVLSIKHPCSIPKRKWSLEAWRANNDKRIISVGWYLRNTRVLYHVALPAWISPLRLLPNKPHIQKYDATIERRFGPGELQDIETLGYVSKGRYDELLCGNIIATELLDASANNVVLDCLVRNTPLVINRHPAAQEYLGENYPLYYDDRSEIGGLLERAEEAHEYLKAMDKSWLDYQRFARQVRKFIGSLQEEA